MIAKKLELEYIVYVKSIKTFRKNVNSIFGSFINRRLFEFLKEFCIIQEEKFDFEEISKILRQFELIKSEDRTINYLFISIISSMELYLKERLLEQIEQDKSFIEKFLNKYDIQRKLTVDDVMKGPEQLAKELLDNIIYHNIEKVHKVYQIFFDFSILEFVEVKSLKSDIKLRHLIVHSAGKARDKELVIQDGFIFTLNRISKFIESIDFYIEHETKKTRFSNYLLKYDRILKPVYKSELMGVVWNKQLKEFDIFNDNKLDKNKIKY